MLDMYGPAWHYNLNLNKNLKVKKMSNAWTDQLADDAIDLALDIQDMIDRNFGINADDDDLHSALLNLAGQYLADRGYDGYP